MSYTVIARKWRPQNFSELVGQEHVSKTLKNAIINDRIAHAYIFTGSRGVGKTSAARIFAKALNCPNVTDGDACNNCPSCQEISTGRSMDVIEIDGASNNSVDNIRDLRDNVRFAPSSGPYKIYIIDEVHMLSKGAFNALLKTLEEPPKHAIFIFATTEIHKVLATILSRCQRFDFKRIPIQKMLDRLSYIAKEEAIDISDDALLQIAKKADGGMRDSQSILDQLISFCGNSISLADLNASLGLIDQDLFFQVTDSFIKKDSAAVLKLIDELFQQGLDLNEMIHGLEEHLRNILVILSTGDDQLIDSIESDKVRYREQAKHFSENDILRIVELLQKAEYSIKIGQNPKLKLELALAKICQMDKSIDIRELLEAVEKKKPNFELNSQKAADNTEIKKKHRVQENLNPYPEHDKHVDSSSVEATTGENPKNNDLATLQAQWKNLTTSFQLSKPALYNCLFQSVLKSHTDKEICISFDDSHNGRLSAGMLRNSLDFVQKSFEKLQNKNYSIKIAFDNFSALGIKIEFNDMDSVVKRMREKNPLLDEVITRFDLKAISMEKE